MKNEDYRQSLEKIISGNSQVRQQAVENLINANDKKISKLLIPEFKNENREVRAAILNVLRKTVNEDVVQVLINALEEKDKDIIMGAAIELGRIKDKRAMPYLMKTHKKSKDFDVQLAAIWAYDPGGRDWAGGELIPESFAYCAACSKGLTPFPVAGGSWSGTMVEYMNMPQIEPHHGLVCEGCQKIFCPVCLGNKATELGVREFVCIECGYKPIKKIFR